MDRVQLQTMSDREGWSRDEYEEKIALLEDLFVAMKTEESELRKTIDRLQAGNRDMEWKFQQLAQENDMLKERDVEKAKDRIDALELSNMEMSQSLDAKLRLLESVHEENEHLKERIKMLKQELDGVMAEMREARTREHQNVVRIGGLEAEMEQARSQFRWISEEYGLLQGLYTDYRKENMRKINEYQCQIELLDGENKRLGDSETRYKQQIERDRLWIEECLEKIRSLQDEKLIREEAFRTEMEAQSKLLELYKESLAEMGQKMEEIESNHLAVPPTDPVEPVRVGDAVVEKKRLKRELELCRAENEKLVQWQEKVQGEIESREAETGRMKQVNEAISKDLEQMVVKNRELNLQYSEICGQYKDLGEKHEMMVQQNRDLGRQVSVLLSQEEEEGAGEESTSSAIITSRLVGFRDIQELQKRNQELLLLVRQLSSKQEELEQGIGIETELKQQLETLREERIKETRLMEEALRQRDSFKLLLVNEGILDERGEYSDKVANYKQKYLEIEEQFEQYRQTRSNSETSWEAKVEELAAERNRLETERLQCLHRIEFLEQRCRVLEESYKLKEEEYKECKNQREKYCEMHKESRNQLELLVEEKLRRQSEEQGEKTRLAMLEADIQFKNEQYDRLLKDYQENIRERERVGDLLAKLQNALAVFEQEGSERIKRQDQKMAILEQQIEEYKSINRDQHQENKILQSKMVLERQGQLAKETEYNRRIVELKNEKQIHEKQIQDMERQYRELEKRLKETDRRMDIVLSLKRGQLNSQAEPSDLLGQYANVFGQLEECRQELECQGRELEVCRAHASELETKIGLQIEELGMQRTRSDQAETACKLAKDGFERERALGKSREEEMETLRRDLERYTTLYKECSERYTHEKIEHGKALETIEKQTKDKLQLADELDRVKDEIGNIRNQMASKQWEWGQERLALDERTEHMEQRERELCAQNEILHKQLEMYLKKREQVEVGQEDQLARLVQHLKRERDVLLAEKETTAQKLRRMEEDSKQLLRQLDDTIRLLERERAETTFRVQKELSQQQNAWMARLEQFNALKDSNILLRQELEEYRKRIGLVELDLQQSLVQQAEVEERERRTRMEMSLLEEKKDEPYSLEDKDGEIQELRNRISELEHDVQNKAVQIQRYDNGIKLLTRQKSELEKSIGERIGRETDEYKDEIARLHQELAQFRAKQGESGPEESGDMSFKEEELRKRMLEHKLQSETRDQDMQEERKKIPKITPPEFEETLPDPKKGSKGARRHGNFRKGPKSPRDE